MSFSDKQGAALAGAKLRRREATAALDEAGEVELVGELKRIGDVLDGTARVGEKPEGAVEERLFQPVLRRLAEEGSEGAREVRRGKPHARGEVANAGLGVYRVADSTQSLFVGRHAQKVERRVLRPQGQRRLQRDGFGASEASKRVGIGEDRLDLLR